MNMTIVVKPSAERRRRLLWVTSRRLRRTFLVYGAISATLGTLAIVVGFANHSLGIEFGGGAMIVGGAYLAYFPLLLIRRALRTTQSTVRIRLTETETVTETPQSEVALKWTAFSDFDEREGFWIGRDGRRTLFTLPQDCMSPGQITEFRNFLARRPTPPEVRAG